MLKINRNLKYVIIAVIVFIVTGFIYYFNIKPRSTPIVLEKNNDNEDKNESNLNDIEEIEKELIEYSENIKVYIVGEVVNSGVYELELGSRIIDVLEKAGGATDEADLKRVNLSEKLEDETKIIIPKEGEDLEYEEVSIKSKGMEDTNVLININTATLEEFKTLPSVGDVVANSILSYRDAKGKFKNIEDIKNVTGIGNKRYEGIKDLITVN